MVLVQIIHNCAYHILKDNLLPFTKKVLLHFLGCHGDASNNDVSGCVIGYSL